MSLEVLLPVIGDACQQVAKLPVPSIGKFAGLAPQLIRVVLVCPPPSPPRVTASEICASPDEVGDTRCGAVAKLTCSRRAEGGLLHQPCYLSSGYGSGRRGLHCAPPSYPGILPLPAGSCH